GEGAKGVLPFVIDVRICIIGIKVDLLRVGEKTSASLGGKAVEGNAVKSRKSLKTQWPPLISSALQRICRNRSVPALACLCGLVLLTVSATAGAEELVQEKSSGPVAIVTRLDPVDPTIGDEVLLKIQVTAEKDVQLLMPEFGEVISGLPISEWLPTERILPDGSTQSDVSIKFQVSVSGEQSIAPILVEFVDNRPGRESSPDDMDAFEILTDRIEFTVKSVLPRGASGDIKPPMPELEIVEESIGRKWAWFVLPFALILGCIVATVVWLKRRKLVRKANAYEVAMARLRPLLNQQASGQAVDADEFFVSISSVVRRYLEDRYDLKAPDLTTDEFLQLAAGEPELSTEHQTLLGEFLSQADVVKFAGVQVTRDEMQRSTELAVRFLEETRENAPDIELDSGSPLPEETRPGGSSFAGKAEGERSEGTSRKGASHV
ncbi:MAG: hypothetical protein AAGG44_16360, partial [Planctomycetota bacterium]